MKIDRQTDREHLLSWLFTFQEKAEVLEPESIRLEMMEKIRKMQERYL